MRDSTRSILENIELAMDQSDWLSLVLNWPSELPYMGVFPYKSYIGMCSPRVGFQPYWR